MKKRFGLPSPALVISSLALFVALGGTTYAATSLPRNSVGTKQLKRGSVTAPKIEREAWHQVGAKGEPGFENGWAPFDPGDSTVGFYKDALGVVHLKGWTYNASDPAGTIFTLPRGYRPRDTLGFAAGASNPSFITVDRKGAVAIFSQGSGDVDVLDGLSFRVDE